MPHLIGTISSLIFIRILSDLLSLEEMGRALLTLGILALLDGTIGAPINQSVFIRSCVPIKRKNIINLINYANMKFRVFSAITITTGVIYLEFYDKNENYLLSYCAFLAVGVIYSGLEVIRQSIAAVFNATSDRVSLAYQSTIDAVLYLALAGLSQFLSTGIFGLVLAIVVAKCVAIQIYSTRMSESNAKVKVQTKYGKVRLLVLIKRITHEARYFSLMGGLGWITSSADRYVVAISSGVAASGVYAVGSGLVARPYGLLSSALTTHYRPSLFSAIVKDDGARELEIGNYWLLTAIIMSSGGLLAFLFLSDIAVEILLGEAFRDSVVDLLPIFSLSMTFVVVSHYFDNKIIARGGSKKLLVTQMCIFPISMLLIAGGAYIGGAVMAVVGRASSDFIRMICAIILSNNRK